jgi:hypothetical protein
VFIYLHEGVTTTFRFRNMSALPPVQWTEPERASGAVSFSQHLSEMHAKLTTTTTPSTSVPVSTHSTVEKITHVVNTVVPQLVESIRHEFIDTSAPSVPSTPTTFAPSSSTPTPATTDVTVVTPPTMPPTFCNPNDYTHVQVNSFGV